MDSNSIKYVKLIIGSILCPLAVNLFIMPVKLNAGGLVGLSKIDKRMIHPKNLFVFF